MFYNLNQFQSKNIEYISKLDVKNLQNACLDWVTSVSSKKTNSINNYYDGLDAFVTYNPTECKVRYSFTNEIYNYLFKIYLIYLNYKIVYYKCFKILYVTSIDKKNIFLININIKN